MAKTKAQLAAELAALNKKTGSDLTAAQAQIDATNQAMAAASNYAPEADNIDYATSVAQFAQSGNQGLAPGILKEGFTEGPLPEQYQKILGENPDILGWRLTTDANGTQRIEVQTGPGTTQTYGARVGGAAVSTGGAVDANTALQNAYASQLAASNAAAEKANRDSAYNILLNEFKKYGLESLVQDAKDIIMQAPSAAEMSIALQNTKAYQQRFSANQDRIKAGLKALTPAEYIGLEDQYQNIMRNYGLPSSYYTKDSLGTQAGFNKFIANDVSAAELEDRIATAQKRVLNADVNVMDALKQFYPDITNGDMLAYTLDPTNALENIKRKVTAAEIGGAALQQGLGTNVGRAEELAKYGITKAQAQQGYQTIGEFLPTATALADIYNKQGLGPYNQATAEAEVFNTADSAAAAQKRRKLSALEQAQFGGQAGTSQGALARERQGSF